MNRFSRVYRFITGFRIKPIFIVQEYGVHSNLFWPITGSRNIFWAVHIFCQKYREKLPAHKFLESPDVPGSFSSIWIKSQKKRTERKNVPHHYLEKYHNFKIVLKFLNYINQNGGNYRWCRSAPISAYGLYFYLLAWDLRARV